MLSKLVAPLLILPALLVLGSCGGLSGGAQSSKAEEWPVCGVDGDCEGALVCDGLALLCVASGRWQYRGMLRLLPPAGEAGIQPEVFSSVELDTGKLANFTMEPALRVVGRVFVEGNPLAAVGQVDVTVVAVEKSGGLESQYHAENGLPEGAPGSSGSWGDGSFEFLARPNRLYDIYVRLPEFSAHNIPVYHVRRAFTPSTTSDPSLVAMDLSVPAPGSYVSVSGRLTWKGGAGRGEGEPLVGAKVLGFDVEGGDVSSTGVTDEDGRFVLLVQPPVEQQGVEYTIQVRSSGANETVPEHVVGRVEVAGDQDLGDIVIGMDLTPRDVVVSLELSEGEAEELVGATLRAEGDFGDYGRIVVERVLQGSSWSSIRLPAGLYSLSLTPPSSSVWAATWRTLTVSLPDGPAGSQAPLQVQLPMVKRGAVSGVVRSGSGRAVAGASVMAYRYGAAYGDGAQPVAVTYSVFSGTTDAQGAYRLPMDTGRYLFVVDPPAAYGLPRAMYWDVVVTGRLDLPLVVPWPRAVTGSINIPDGVMAGAQGKAEPASGLRVEFYGDEWPAALPVLPAAESLCDESGVFSLLLPSEQ